MDMLVDKFDNININNKNNNNNKNSKIKIGQKNVYPVDKILDFNKYNDTYLVKFTDNSNYNGDFSFIDDFINSVKSEKQKNIINNLRSQKKEIISIHFRRTDYLEKQNSHPICSPHYYKKAISEFDKDKSIFLIFSDDIKWCKENLKSNNKIGEGTFGTVYIDDTYAYKVSKNKKLKPESEPKNIIFNIPYKKNK